MFIDKETLKLHFIQKLQSLHGKTLSEASNLDKYQALASLVRDQVSQQWVETRQKCRKFAEKEVYYFSIEFLLGRLLGNNLMNLGLTDVCQEALAELGIDLADLEQQEADAGLGNGGLGRLAACFLDSMASLGLPCHGCGIRYKYGLFEQQIVNGYQVERPDNWLKHGYSWEFRKADKSVEVRFGGTVRVEPNGQDLKFIHENYETVLAVPYDIPIVGYKNEVVNTLRLWSAEAPERDFDLSSFNKGDYLKAVEYRYGVEAISEILYPEDSYHAGRVLRLKQQYFFVSAGLKSIVRRYKKRNISFEEFSDNIAIHINDTHPALCIPELMRILMDEEGLGWDEAWKITTSTISYTNHTIMPEALEKWPVDLFRELLPRIYMIVQEINERFCRSLWNRYSGDWQKIHEMAVLADGYVKMAHLAVVGSYSVNGVAQIHTEILKKDVMKPFYQTYPYKFSNKTNGITHRRWLLKANPSLAELVSETIGTGWIEHPGDLKHLLRYHSHDAFQEQVMAIKRHNKQKMLHWVQNKYGLALDGQSIFDVHIKRIHAYKRQLLNVLHILYLYQQIKSHRLTDFVPQTFFFAGKSAPGYFLAKKIIKLIHTVAELVNQDRAVHDYVKVLFLENYSVSLAELLIPAADVSEQISTASKEASGTGNMKFMMNGAITCGTLDGANIEIAQEVGSDNMITFGLTADEVLQYYQNGQYDALALYQEDETVKQVVDALVDGTLPGALDEFRPIYDWLIYNHDEFFVLKDFAAYIKAQQKVQAYYKNPQKWAQMAIANIAGSGKFSSDRTVHEYAIGIWKVRSIDEEKR